MPNTSKTVIVLCKEVTQLLVADKTQKSQTECSYETPSTLCSPWVRILTLDFDLESTTGGVYKLLFGLAPMLISGKQDMREEDRIQSSEGDICQKSIKGEHKLLRIYGDLCE